MRHLPTSLILLVSTITRINSMAPPARIECALTLVGLKPTCGEEILMDSRRALVISVLLMVDHFLFLDNSARGVWSLAPSRNRCATHILNTATAHARGCLVFTFPIDYPLVTFLYVVNRSLTKISVSHV